MTFAHDLRFALRSLARSPGFTAAAVAMLALGIGANTAVFSVVDAVLLKPLPYADAGRLLDVSETNPQQPGDPYEASYPNFLDWRARSESLAGLAAWMSATTTLTGDGEPTRLATAFASSDLLDVLGAPPARGRFFLREEDRVGGAARAVLGYGLWRRRFGGDPSVVGRTLTLDGVPRLVVGVAPEGLRLPGGDAEVFLPLAPSIEPMRLRSIHVLSVVGRLRPSVTLAAARSEMDAVARRIGQDDPGADPGHGTRLVPLRERLTGPVRPVLAVLSAAVAFVLLISCANVAGLLLARAAARRKEAAIRTALGASQIQLARQWLAESLALSLAGGAAGLALTAWSAGPMARLLPASSSWTHIDLDGRVLVLTAAISIFSALLLALPPLFASARRDPFGALRGTGLASSRRGWPTGRQALTVLQIAVTLMLLTGTGLLVQNLRRLAGVDPGFRPGNILTMRIALPEAAYNSRARVVGWHAELQEKVRALPGVLHASAVSSLPVSGGDGNGDLTAEGQVFASGQAPAASFRRCLPDYFETMGIPLLVGRDFDSHDGGSPFVVIVSSALARRLWPGTDPIGRRIKVGPPDSEPWLTVVGVAGDVRNVELASGPALATYEPYAQRPRLTMDLVVRASSDAARLAPALRDLVRQSDPNILVENVQTMDGRIRDSLGTRRRLAELFGAFAASGLLLAALGLGGLLAWNVTQRRRDIGIRMALGARSADVQRMVVREGLLLTAAGIALGLAASAGAARALHARLFEVGPARPMTFFAPALLLLGVAALAAWVPARRAARVDPATALRLD